MAGLYIHIPFCASRCIYCGFYSTTLTSMKQRYVDAVCQEMTMRGHSAITTIYIGGGTPSQLAPQQLRQLFRCIYDTYQVSVDAEVTIECNPDDITDEKSALLRELSVNRVSMGAQTFSDERLKFIHRRHNSLQVDEAVDRLRKAGIHNISIDLMFGFPGETLADWNSDINHALSLNVEHISAYSLMIEEGTPLHRMLEEGAIKEIDDELSLQMYTTLIDRLTADGYEHYEISNFAKIIKRNPSDSTFTSFRSRHNSSYWHGIPYIGIGAAAHSYDIDTRSWNVADIERYMSMVEKGQLPVEGHEILDEQTRYNDLVTTALRTREGINMKALSHDFSPQYYELLSECAKPHLEAQHLEITNGNLHLTQQGIYVSNDIMSDLISV